MAGLGYDNNVNDSDTLFVWFVAISAGVAFTFTVLSLCKKHEGKIFKLYFWVRFICLIVSVALVILAANKFLFGFYNSAVAATIFGFSFYF